MSFRVPSMLVVCLLSACKVGPQPSPGTNSQDSRQCVSVDVESLDFGDVTIGDRAERIITLHSDCDGVAVDSVQFDSPDFSVISIGAVSLNGGDAVDVIVGFEPSTPGGFADELHIAAGGTVLDVVVDAQAVGSDVNVSAGDIAIDAVVGCPSKEVLTVSNDGNAPLYIESVRLGGSYAFSLDNPAPLTLAPGASIDVTVTYDPTTPGLDTGVVIVETDDPVEPTVERALIGDGTAFDEIVDRFDVGEGVFVLSEYPVPSSLRVSALGAPAGFAWGYDPQNNAIVLGIGGPAPQSGTLVVEYAVATACE